MKVARIVLRGAHFRNEVRLPDLPSGFYIGLTPLGERISYSDMIFTEFLAISLWGKRTSTPRSSGRAIALKSCFAAQSP